MEITLPENVAVMTLPNVAFFPQAVMPLHIFEERYREMLREILSTHRLFAIAGLDPQLPQFEAPHRIATVGIVRACQDAENGTSNLLLQGLSRVEVLEIVRENPFRIIRIRPVQSTAGATAAENALLRSQLRSLIMAKKRLGESVPGDLVRFLQEVEDPESFVDLAAFALCDDSRLKQRLLETLSVHERLQLLHHRLELDVSALKLRKKLQGTLSDESISDN